MNKRWIGLMLICSGTLSQCYYDNYAELQPASSLINTCDTSDVVSYNRQVAPLLGNSCGSGNSCHNSSSSSGVDLSSYAQVKTHVDNGRLLGAMEWKQGYSPMPKGAAAPTDACQLGLIKKWIREGANNN